MGNSESVKIEIAARIIETIVEEYATIIAPDVNKIYMDDDSIPNTAHF